MGLIESLDRLDRSAFLAWAGQGGPWADQVFTLISSAWVAALVWFALWAVRRSDYDLRGWIWLLVTLVAAFAAADWMATLLKNSLGRPRPCWSLEGQFRLVAACKGQFGLVSGHAATTWALLTVYLASRPCRYAAVLAVAWAIAVPVSRVYLGVHYPGDVLGGILVGILTARILMMVRPLPLRS